MNIVTTERGSMRGGSGRFGRFGRFDRFGTLTLRLIAVLLIVVCLAVGVVGLILPLIPGLLFLALALMLVAKFFPTADRQLRRNRTIRSYLDSADGFGGMNWSQKFQYGLLAMLRLIVDGVAACVGVVSRVFGFAVAKYQSYR